MTDTRRTGALGVLGGMGALASAEFVKSIYESSRSSSEQDSPIVLLYSDPTFPDRTQSLLRGDDRELLDRLVDALTRLRDMGASRTVICCVTIHSLLPRLPPEVGSLVISLLDVIVDRLEQVSEEHLLICSSGARELGLFQSHPRWDRVVDRVILPSAADQARIHEWLYEIKRNRGAASMTSFIETLLGKHRTGSFIAGCSEMHIVTKQMRSKSGHSNTLGCVDPLTIIAEQWAAGGRPR